MRQLDSNSTLRERMIIRKMDENCELTILENSVNALYKHIYMRHNAKHYLKQLGG